MITDSITYNVRERGRSARGVDRNFDTVALASLINGPAVQERVKHGDMYGYYGHWPRLLLGIDPSEGGVVDGKHVSVYPCMRTVEIHAEPDGTITHRAEFLDTEEGRKAAEVYNAKAGGFSSAIDPVPGTMPVIPRGFYGFDYVKEPNYTFNRGHKVVLDGVEQPEELALILDAVVGDFQTREAVLGRLFDSVQGQLLNALQALDAVTKENRGLINMLARKGHTPEAVAAVLDSVAIPPTRVGMPPDFGRFRDVDLVPLAKLPEPAAPKQDDPYSRFAADRFGFGKGR